MSSPLAIAAVTAVLKDLLNDGLINHDLAAHVGSITVSALPPDRIETGAQEPNQLNLFLYQVTPNPGWRNTGLPSLDSRGDGRLSNPPLALDLHYLLTAYGRDDLNAEILLGYGMFLLHKTPVLTRKAIRRTLTGNSPVTAALMPPSEALVGVAGALPPIYGVRCFRGVDPGDGARASGHPCAPACRHGHALPSPVHCRAGTTGRPRRRDAGDQGVQPQGRQHGGEFRRERSVRQPHQ